MPRRSRWPTTASRAWTLYIARIFNTYGPRMRPADGRAIPTFIRQAIAGKPLTVFGEGSQTRSFCYVSDLVEGFLRLIGCDHHEPVNLGNPGEFTILELAELLIELTASSSSVVHEALSRTTRPCAGSTSRWPASS